MNGATTQGNTISAIWETLGEVIDPELGVPITDLGLVYRVEMVGDVAHIDITTTTPICPLGSYLQRAVESKAASLPGVDHARVEIVHEPLWCPEMMNDAAKRKLGWDC